MYLQYLFRTLVLDFSSSHQLLRRLLQSQLALSSCAHLKGVELERIQILQLQQQQQQKLR